MVKKTELLARTGAAQTGGLCLLAMSGGIHREGVGSRCEAKEWGVDRPSGGF